MDIHEASAITTPSLAPKSYLERHLRQLASVKAGLRRLIAPSVTLGADGEGELPDAAISHATAYLLRHLDAGDAFELVSESNYDPSRLLADVLDGDKDAASVMLMAMVAGAKQYAMDTYIRDAIDAVTGEMVGDASRSLFNEHEAADRDQRAREMRAAIPSLLGEAL